MRKILLFLWQLPQNSLGWLFSIWLSARNKNFLTKHHRDAHIMLVSGFPGGGVTLGKWIFINADYYGTPYVISTEKHEYGHSIQSLILGWLYLPYIGLQSLIHAIFHKKGTDYSHFWTEKWADKLADKYYE